MRRTQVCLVLAAVWLSACERQPTEPEFAARVLTTPTSSGNPSRPIAGNCRTTWIVTGATFQPPPNDDQLATLSLVHNGTCLIEHLGITNLLKPETVYFDASGVHVVGDAVTFTAANGDELHAQETAVIGPPDVDGDFSFQGYWTFTGGTGRFTGATGGVSFEGNGNIPASSTQRTLRGSISY